MASTDHLRSQVAGQPGIQQQQPQSNTAQSQQQAEYDPVYRFKLLIPRLKESLVNLMKIAGQSLQQSSTTDDAMVNIDGQHQKFEKSLEEFYSMCDQIEVNLRLALEHCQQNADTAKYIPLPVNIPNEDSKLPQGQSLQYQQYMTIVKMQINCAKEVHDLLVECSRKISEK